MSDVNTGKSVNNNSQRIMLQYILIFIIALAGFILLFKGALFSTQVADAKILKDEFFLNEKLVFADNTENASKWLWEFGDGRKSVSRNGSYQYAKAGAYIVRLTVDGLQQLQFPITIRDTVSTLTDTAVSINGPTLGIVDEEIRLDAAGTGNQFQWSFGETGRVDVKGRSALYTYHKAGTFLVQLRSDKSKTVNHVMHITDPTLDTVLVIPGEGERRIIDDIRTRLQAIADGAEFNPNYYYLIKTYLCNDEKVTVAIEQDSLQKKSDFYSYCIGLTFGGDISVDQAQLTVRPNSNCASLLTVKQHSANLLK